MRELEGNLFDTELEAIGQGVNCQGKMGAGIAADFSRRYPKMYESYRIHCADGTLTPGDVFLYRGDDGKVIVNMASQRIPGRDARYDWLASSALNAAAELLDIGINQLALPRIGCGIGGLDWEAVRIILQMVEFVAEADNTPFEFIIYTPKEPF